MKQERVGVLVPFLLERFWAYTAPAIALAAKVAEATKGGDAAMLVLAADHLIAEQAVFAAAVQDAAALARADSLDTFGIVPAAPEIDLGVLIRSMKRVPALRSNESKSSLALA